MIQLSDKATGTVIGTISAEQLQFLIDQLEEENAADQDYWLNRATLDIFQEQGADAHLLGLLASAMGEREELEIVWAEV
ncbi:MAG: hypothetical protein ACKN9T_17815 [Candidatus Methylumidiphilus sp.]